MPESSPIRDRHLQIARQSGSTLPLVLALLTILTATAVAITRTAVANTRLTSSVSAGGAAFRLATAATAAALQILRDQPALLPASGIAPLPAMREQSGSAEISVHHIRTVASCTALAPLTAERHDYEIRVTANGPRGALSHHRQGIYTCRETCAAMPCIGVETLAAPTYWYLTRPDKP